MDLLLLLIQAVIYKRKEERRLINLENINEIQGSLEDQIQSKISMIDERNELIDSLKKEVNQIQEKPAFNKEDLVSILKLVELNIHSNVEWELFRKRYEELNPSFLGILLQTFPELSKSEIRLSLLIKLSMTSKEMAVVLNISPGGVKKARYRLRKKMRLSEDQNLDDTIIDLK